MMFRANSHTFSVAPSIKPLHFHSARLCRFYANSSVSTGKSPVSSGWRNTTLLSVVLSTAGISAFLYQAYSSPKLHADALPSKILKPYSEERSREVRNILHGQKADTYNGVNVETILKRCEETTTGTGIWYHLNQVASNCPMEDDHAEMTLRSPSGSRWNFFAVIDGHVSWETSRALADRLIPSVSGALSGLYSRKESPTNDAIDSAIKDAFVSLDDDFVYKSLGKALESGSRALAAQMLSQAWAGAVAMLAFHDQALGQVKIALTGDLRAVRGRRSIDGKWDAKVLTVEQDGDNENEAERIRKEHPDEPDVIKDGRVLGFQPTRMFGDASLKWSPEVQKELHSKFLGLRLRDVVKTPPYVTAEPVVTTTDVKDGDFLILGCDGLWESLNSEEAVTLVGSWLEIHGPKARDTKEIRRAKDTVNSSSSGSSVTKEKSVRYEQWRIPKQFVTVDDNAATHLIRNALGGADKETMAALLTRTGTLSRRLRDDITVTVVFFGEAPER